jgi:hypothetical protein
MGSGDNPLGGYPPAPCVHARHASIEQLACCCHPSLVTNLAAVNATKFNATHWQWPTVEVATSICCILQRNASNRDAFNIPIRLLQLQHKQQQQRLHTLSLQSDTAECSRGTRSIQARKSGSCKAAARAPCIPKHQTCFDSSSFPPVSQSTGVC